MKETRAEPLLVTVTPGEQSLTVTAISTPAPELPQGFTPVAVTGLGTPLATDGPTITTTQFGQLVNEAQRLVHQLSTIVDEICP
jgi:hypothetical protein